MALALECPACGAKHRVENLSDAPTFRCDRCGQVLKMPTPVTTGGPPPPTRAGASAATAATAATGAAPAVAPPPRRRTPDAVGTPSVAAATAGVSATLAAVGPVEPGDRSTNRSTKQAVDQSTRRGRRTPPPAQNRTKVGWYW